MDDERSGPQRTPVSVVMSVCNAERYLDQSIVSILSQDHSDFEFIIIDDGSTDDSQNIIKKYKDPRIRLIAKLNTGLADSLNIGIQQAKHNLIARMDADDIASPERISSQLLYFKNYPECAVVGSNAIEIDEEGNFICKSRLPENDADIKQRMQAGLQKGRPSSPFYHSSVMFRKDLFNIAGGYLQNMAKSQDLVLFYKMSPLGLFGNIADPLIQYRIQRTSVSRVDPRKIKRMQRILTDIIQNGSITVTQKLFLKKLASPSDEKDQNYHYLLYKAKKLLKNRGQFIKSVRTFCTAIRIYPLRPYGYKSLIAGLVNRK